MAGYPLTLRPGGARCLVVGGGKVAERKVSKLLEAGFEVVIISPRLTEPLSLLARSGKVSWEQRQWREGDEEGARLVFAATDDAGVNAQVAEACRERGIPCNRADDPTGGDFSLPAVHREGEITLSVDTGGLSPAMAAWLRDRLKEALPPGAAAAAKLLGKIKKLGAPAPGGEAYLAALEDGLCEKLAAGDLAGAAKTIDGAFGPGTWDRIGKGSDQ